MLDENDDGWYKALSFSKLGGQFKLAIETGVEYDPANINTTPITSASRETRLEAVEELPRLYQALLSAFEAEIERVNAGIAAVEQLAEELRPPKARQYPC